MPTKRRKRRRSINAVAWLWVLVTINVVAGFAFSPLTAIQKVRVSGLPIDDQERVSQVLQTLKGVPAMRLNSALAVSQIENNSEIERASFFPNLFGRGVVRVVPKQPVVRIRESSLCLDRFGTPFMSHAELEKIPTLLPPKRAFAASLTFVGSWDSGQTAQLCGKLSAQMPNVRWTVAVNDRGEISLQIDDNGKVELGEFKFWPKKIEKLKALLTDMPDVFQKVKSIELSSLESPVYTPR